MHKFILLITFGLMALFSSPAAIAAIQAKTITYQDGDITLQGYLTWDDSSDDKRPGVLVVHEWWGLNDYVRNRADELAEQGYMAFALDMYGEGKVTKHPAQASEWMKEVSSNTEDWQRRALLGLEVLTRQKLVDTDNTAAIGYCFGGATVLQIAFAGADLRGVVSFHGSLPIPEDDQAKGIKASILVQHGNADAFIKQEEVQSFQAAMEKSGADWQMIEYGGARHAFTNPDADRYGINNLKYNSRADIRSWHAMQDFFLEIFAP